MSDETPNCDAYHIYAESERSWESSVHDDDAFESPESDECDDVPEPEPPVEVWNAPGIKLWDFASKGGRAVCLVCGQKFVIGNCRPFLSPSPPSFCLAPIQ